MKPHIEVVSDVDISFAVACAVFAGYLLLALFGSRERGADAPLRLRDLRRRLFDWIRVSRFRR